MAITPAMIRECYARSKPQMPPHAALVLAVDRRISQRTLIGNKSCGRTRDELLQAVCEDMAREVDPRREAESLFTPPSEGNRDIAA